MTQPTDLDGFLSELNAGILKQKLETILSDCAMNVILNGDKKKKGKVTLEISMQRVGETDQVVIDHKLTSVVPTQRGKRSEEDTTSTGMFVGQGGQLSIEQPRINHEGQFGLTIEQDGRSALDIQRERLQRQQGQYRD